MTTQLGIKRILFATDFLDSSRQALDYAVAFAHHFQATLIILHVVELSDAGIEAELITSRPCIRRQEAEEQLDAYASGIRGIGLNVEAYVKDGIPYETILHSVTALNADMLVLGVHRVHRGLDHFLVGSNVEKILLSVPCPTLTVGVRALAQISLLQHTKEILYVSDFTPEAAAAAPYAFLLGKEFNVPVDICQLAPEMVKGNHDQLQNHAEAYCEGMRGAFAEPQPDWCLPAFHLDHCIGFDEIMKRVQTQRAGLIVLGVQQPLLLKRHFHTSFAYQLLANALGPVLTIHDRGHCAAIGIIHP